MHGGAKRYHNRLYTVRAVWAVFMGAVWVFVIVQTGWANWQPFTIVMILVYFFGNPRNAAKVLARRARRQADLRAAAEDELKRHR
jgi:hypothetical protein